MALTSIRASGDKIEIVNQLLLPHTTEYIEIKTIEDCHEAIKSMKIRGAPAIASLAALTLASQLSLALRSSNRTEYLQSVEKLKSHVSPILDYLYTARPTAVNLGQATRRLQKYLDEQPNNGDAKEATEGLIREARSVADEDVGRNKSMGKHGGDWLVQRVKDEGLSDNGLNVLTVCNTGSLATSGYGTALGLITYLHETSKLGRAFYTQTAPYHQGSRLTSLELISLKIPSVMICDTMVGSLFQHHKIHAVAVGADRIARNGDTANKIGTYNAAVLAARHKTPFIVVAPITTVDLDIANGSSIPIEQRPAIEACLARGAVHPPPSGNAKEQAVVMLTPQDIDLQNGVYNPSFDVTPAELITAIVTEKGVAVKKEGEKEFDLIQSGIV